MGLETAHSAAGAVPLEWISDPIHEACEAPIRWSRGNVSEFLPGVLTPLTWDFWSTSERAGRRIYFRLGLAYEFELEPPKAPENRTTSIFHGWPVANVDVLRSFIDRAPGNAGDSFERRLIGESDLPIGRPKLGSRKRPLNMALKSGLWFLTYASELRRCAHETDTWWRSLVTRMSKADLKACRAAIDETIERQIDVSVVAGFGTLGGQIFFSQLEDAIPPSLHHHLLSVTSGHGMLTEVETVVALWDVAMGRMSKDDFLRRYGFYGAAVGELENPSWRHDPSQLDAMLAHFRGAHEGENPRVRCAEREERLSQALTDLKRALPARKWRKVRSLIERVDRFTVWREEGKACSLRCYDAMRAIAARMGELLTADGQLSSPDQIYFFTIDELKGLPFSGMAELALWRQARRDFYRTLEIPDAFIGSPIVRAHQTKDTHRALEDDHRSGPLEGVGVSAGVAEGKARVIADPARVSDFEPGDILVCTVTDPSWAPLFMKAGGIITDIGGMLSHGAVIARELGLPCIVNTRSGTRRIPDGASIRMDGSTGEITIREAEIGVRLHGVH